MVRFPPRAWLPLALICCVGVLLVHAYDLGRLARIVPVVVAWPLLFLLLLLLILDSVPAAGAFVLRYSQFHFRRTETLMDRMDLKEDDGGRRVSLATEIRVMVWTMALPLLIMLLGIPVGSALFVLLHLRQRVGLPLWKALSSGVATAGVLLLLSHQVLHTPLYNGVFW